jgi:hypothetical protein
VSSADHPARRVADRAAWMVKSQERLAALAPGRSADAATSTTQTPGLQLRIGNGSRLRRAALAPRPRRRQPATRHADAARRRIDELTSPAKIALTIALLVPPRGIRAYVRARCPRPAVRLRNWLWTRTPVCARVPAATG